MALPAGRYGVTKNQLLKIKKLPMNTIKLIEELTEKYDLLGTAAFKNSTSVVTDSSDLVESGAVYTALQSKADNSVIGTVEDGATASQAYAVGQHFIRDGAFCTVTQAISSGGTLTEGTNYTAGDVASELDTVDITSQCTFSTDCSWDTNGWNRIIKKGNMLDITLRFSTPSESSLNKKVVTLPRGLLPFYQSQASYLGIMHHTWQMTIVAMLSILSTGEIYLTGDNWLANTSGVFHACLIVNK